MIGSRRANRSSRPLGRSQGSMRVGLPELTDRQIDRSTTRARGTEYRSDAMTTLVVGLDPLTALRDVGGARDPDPVVACGPRRVGGGRGRPRHLRDTSAEGFGSAMFGCCGRSSGPPCCCACRRWTSI